MSLISELVGDLFRHRHETLKKKWEKLPPKTRERLEKKIVRFIKSITHEAYKIYMRRSRAQKSKKK